MQTCWCSEGIQSEPPRGVFPQALAGQGDEDLVRIWLEGGRSAFARTIRDKQALAAADAKHEVQFACGFHQMSARSAAAPKRNANYLPMQTKTSLLSSVLPARSLG